MDKLPKLSPRLAALAEMVRPGARLLDVGSDHAFLPVYLVLTGKIGAALASDIAAGPIARAKAHIDEYGLCDSIGTLRTPGLENTAFFGATDIVIAGMGGELIVSILRACPYVRAPGISLILQPMTKSAALRSWLAEEGFAVDLQRLIREDGRFYEALRLHYTGEPYPLTPFEKEIGVYSPEDRAEYGEFLTKKKRQYEKIVRGKKAGGQDCAEEKELLGAIGRALLKLREGNDL